MNKKAFFFSIELLAQKMGQNMIFIEFPIY